jgi:prepilin-type N-terminal cleavage/methylation domain-containing protein
MRGFSLIEVSIAAALFLVTMTGVVSATRTAGATFEHQRKLTQAVGVAEFAMEMLLLRYGTSDALAANATQSADGTVSAATAQTLCLRPTLEATAGCDTASHRPRIGFSNAIDLTVGDGTTRFGVNWVVGSRAKTRLRHIILIVAWRESTGIQTVELQTYRP